MVWEKELGGSRGSITEGEFYKLPSTESIRRQRQLSQMMKPCLRGSSYADRHTKKEPKVRKEVNDAKWDEIEKINEKRLKTHSVAFQYVYNNEKISPENKKVLLKDIARMEKDNEYARKCAFTKDARHISAICFWDETGHEDIWMKSQGEATSKVINN